VLSILLLLLYHGLRNPFSSLEIHIYLYPLTYRIYIPIQLFGLFPPKSNYAHPGHFAPCNVCAQTILCIIHGVYTYYRYYVDCSRVSYYTVVKSGGWLRLRLLGRERKTSSKQQCGGLKQQKHNT